MGPLLASTHFAADAGIVYPMSTYPQTGPDRRGDSASCKTLPDACCGQGVFDHYNFELIDSDHTPLENFERYRVLNTA